MCVGEREDVMVGAAKKLVRSDLGLHRFDLQLKRDLGRRRGTHHVLPHVGCVELRVLLLLGAGVVDGQLRRRVRWVLWFAVQ